MKKVLLVFLSLLMILSVCFSFVSCNSGTVEEPSSDETTTQKGNSNMNDPTNQANGTITFEQGVSVYNAAGDAVTSGESVPAGKYHAVFSSASKLQSKFLQCNGNDVAVALNGTATYEFELGAETLAFSTHAETAVSTGAKYDLSVDLEWLADASVMYDDATGKYYLAVASNWGKKFGKGEQIWEVFEANDLSDFSNKADMKEYCIMSLEEFAQTPGVNAYTGGGQWAPEIQKFGDYYYITTTYSCTAHTVKDDRDDRSDRGGRGNSHCTLAIFRSTSPTEGWEVWCPHLDTPMTGENTTWDIIDGIIWYEDGKPYMIASHCWPSQPKGTDGSFAYIQLKDDLSGIAAGAEWHEMFWAHDVGVDGTSGTTDGPYFYKNSKGELILLWSDHEPDTSSGKSYCVIQTKSSNGKLSGAWEKKTSRYLYHKNISGLNIDHSTGGHPGLVQTPDGQLYMTLHLNMIESSSSVNPKNKIPHLIAVRENSEGYLEWGTDPDLLQVTVSSGSSKLVDLAKGVPQDQYSASFTIVKDGMPNEKFLGFRWITSDRKATTLLINSAGKFKVGNGTAKSFAMPNEEELTLKIVCQKGETPKVYLNGWFQQEMTDALADAYSEEESLSTLQLALYEAGANAFFKDWSFTTGASSQ